MLNHRVWKYRVPSPCRVPSPSMEVSSTVTECRVPSPCRVPSTEYRVPSPSRTFTECRVPSTECSPSIENHHRVSKYGVPSVTEDRVPSPSGEYQVPSTEYQVTNIETRINMSSSRITENGVPSNEQQTN